ncbi:MAG: TylF/MycF/NovP-related O-methyltransferase [Solirubrobacteraceae bacterium]
MLRRLKRAAGAAPSPAPAPDPDALTTSPEDRAILDAALPFTMTGPARLQALVDAVRYCVRREIPGAFAECGVWRGGSVLAMILTLQELGRSDRDIHLFDTFEGMTAPTAHDVSPVDPPATETWEAARQAGERAWDGLFSPDVFNLEDVRRTILGTGYPPERIHFVKGPVEDTLPDHPTGQLALLRLDTDWYESTKAEMQHLYPKLVAGGVLIVDDYGHWEGARRAVEEHFDAHGDPLLLNRIDYTGRIGIKH